MRQQGVTLIELLVVIGIIMALLALSAPPFMSWLARQRIEDKAVQIYTDLKWAQQEAVRQGEYGVEETVDAMNRRITTLLKRKVYFVFDSATGGYKILRWQDEDANGVAGSGEFAPDFDNDGSTDAPMKEIDDISPASIGILSSIDKVACSNNNKSGNAAIVNVSKCPDIVGDGGANLMTSNDSCIVFNSKGFYEGADNASIYITDGSRYAYGISINVTGIIKLCRWNGSQWVRLR